MAIVENVYREPELTAPVNQCLPGGRLNPAGIGWSKTMRRAGNADEAA